MSLRVDEPSRSIFRVNRRAYVQPEILDLERERIFDHVWLYVGHESEVANPGDFKTREVGGRPVILCRGSDGKARVLVNSCTHRGAMVCRAHEGNANTFQCFYHAWTFNNRGELVGVPDPAGYGPGFRREELALREPPRLANYRGLIFICFDPKVEELTDFLAGARDVLDLIFDQAEDGLMEIVEGTHKYSVRGNWKLLAENSTDHSHGIPTHQTYFKNYLGTIGVDLTREGVIPEMYCRSLGNGHALMEYRLPWGRPVAFWQPTWGEEARVEIEAIRRRLAERWGEERARKIAEFNRNLVIFPNLVINDIMAVVVRTFFPDDVGNMKVLAWALAPRNEARKWRHLRLDNFLTFLGPGGFATPDDLEAMEACQRGYRAFKEVGWSEMSHGAGREHDIQDDETLRAFWRQWAKLVTTDQA